MLYAHQTKILNNLNYMLSESSRIPPCTLLSQTSTIFPEGYNFKYEQDIKILKPYSNRHYGDSQINLFCLTDNNISLTTAFSQRSFLTTSSNVFITMAFSQRLSHNVSLTTFLSHNVFLTTSF